MDLIKKGNKGDLFLYFSFCHSSLYPVCLIKKSESSTTLISLTTSTNDHFFWDKTTQPLRTLSVSTLHLWSWFSNFWFPYWARAGAELGHPDTAAISSLKEARSPDPKSLRTQHPAHPPICPDSGLHRSKVKKQSNIPRASCQSWQCTQRRTTDPDVDSSHPHLVFC